MLASKQKTNFIIIGTQRCGTTYLGSLLNSHPKIYMAKELFKVNGDGYNVDEDNFRYFGGSIADFLDSFYAKRELDVHAVGFKIMFDQLKQFPGIIGYIKNRTIKCIYIERANLLKTHISRLCARSRGFYHTEKSVAFNAIEVEIEQIESEIDKITKNLEKMRELAQQLDAYTIIYESLVRKKEKTLQDLQNFLLVKHMPLKSRLIKINSDRLSEVIVNYTSVYNRLKNTPYSKFLDPI